MRYIPWPREGRLGTRLLEAAPTTLRANRPSSPSAAELSSDRPRANSLIKLNNLGFVVTAIGLRKRMPHCMLGPTANQTRCKLALFCALTADSEFSNGREPIINQLKFKAEGREPNVDTNRITRCRLQGYSQSIVSHTRLELIEKRIGQSERNITTRFDDFEKNMA